jgi:hypothetical protein
MKLAAAHPASLEAIPKQDRIHLPGEFINPPHAVALNHFAGCIERQAVQPAEGIDLVPVFADVTILKSDVVGAIGAPARTSAAGIEALALIMNSGIRAIALPIRRASSEDSLPTPTL